MPPDPVRTAPARLLSLDAFRGLTMAAMVIVNNPGDWAHVYPPLLHAQWHGCTPTDLVFPFFLFIVGVAITLSSKSASPARIGSRAAKLVGLGLFLAGFPRFNPARWRLPGVLQRIGLCYLGAALLYRWSLPPADQPGRIATTARRVGLAAATALVGYWAVLLAVPGATGQRYDLTPEGNVGAMLDRALMAGHLWKPAWDPEGLLSTVPALGTTLAGVLAGLWLKASRPGWPRAAGLAAGGAAAAAVGLAWNLVLPLNKSLWTSSYAIYTAGLGAIFLAACYVVVDLWGARRLAYPFVVLGTNAIALFVLSGLLTKITLVARVTLADGSEVAWRTWAYGRFFEPLASPVNASLLYAAANLGLLYVVLWVLFKRGIILKV